MREAEERPAPDRSEADDEPAHRSDAHCDDPVAVREVPELLLRPDRVHDRLGQEGQAADDQHDRQDLALHRVDAFPVAVVR